MNDYTQELAEAMMAGKCPIQTAQVKTLIVTVDGEEHLTVNDVVISGDAMSWIHFGGNDAENVLGSFDGTGVCISTAVGSTAFNKNNGGVVLPLLSQNIGITGIATHTKIIEVMHSQEFEMEFKSRTDTYVWIDGNGKRLGPYKEGKVGIKPGPWLNLGFFKA